MPLFFATSLKYLILPFPFILFYAGFPDPCFRDVFRQYTLPIAVLSLSTVFFISKERLHKFGYIIFLTIAFAYPSWRHLVVPGKYDTDRAKDIPIVKTLIPPDASLLAHCSCISQFIERKDVSNWIYRSRPPDYYEYVLLDGRFMPSWWKEKDSLQFYIEKLSNSKSWETRYGKNALYLFRKIVPIPY
jgi:hypothetical protein